MDRNREAGAQDDEQQQGMDDDGQEKTELFHFLSAGILILPILRRYNVRHKLHAVNPM
jgi:hypothetical protein